MTDNNIMLKDCKEGMRVAKLAMIAIGRYISKVELMGHYQELLEALQSPVQISPEAASDPENVKKFLHRRQTSQHSIIGKLQEIADFQQDLYLGKVDSEEFDLDKNYIVVFGQRISLLSEYESFNSLHDLALVPILEVFHIVEIYTQYNMCSSYSKNVLTFDKEKEDCGGDCKCGCCKNDVKPSSSGDQEISDEATLIRLRVAKMLGVDPNQICVKEISL